MCRLFLVRQGGLRRGGGQRPLQMVVWVEMLKEEVSSFVRFHNKLCLLRMSVISRSWSEVRADPRFKPWPDISLNFALSSAFHSWLLSTWLLSGVFLGIEEYVGFPFPGNRSWTWEEEFVPLSVPTQDVEERLVAFHWTLEYFSFVLLNKSDQAATRCRTNLSVLQRKIVFALGMPDCRF